MKQSAAAGLGMDLTEGSIVQNLIRFSFPVVLSYIIQYLYGIVDLIIIGNHVGDIGSVGVSIGGEAVDLLAAAALSFSMAGQIYTAQAFGAKKQEKLKAIISTFLTFSGIASAVFIVLFFSITKPVLRYLNCPAEAVLQAGTYMRITTLGIPAIFGYNAVCSVLRGLGESKKPLLFVIISAVVNIILDELLVAVIHLEAAGTAIATIAAQYGSFAAALMCLIKKRRQFGLDFRLHTISLNKEVLMVLLKLGIPQVVRTVLIRCAMIWVNAMVNAYGMVPSTTSGVGNKLMKFLEVFMLGVNTASAAMVGQNLGAGKNDRAKKTTLATFCLTMACATVSSILCLICPRQIFSLFSKSEPVLALGVTYLYIMIIHFYLSSVTGSFQAMVNGSGNTKLAMVIGVLDGLVSKIGLSLIFVKLFHLGYLGLFWAVACSRFLSAVVCVSYFLHGKWKQRTVLSA